MTRGVVCKGVLLASFSEQYARSLAWGSATENTCSGGPSDPLILRLVLNAKLDRSSFELGYSFDSCPQSYDPTNRNNVGWFNAQRKWNEFKIVDWSLSLAPWGGLMIANVCPHVGGGCLSLTLAPMRIKRIATDQLFAPTFPGIPGSEKATTSITTDWKNLLIHGPKALSWGTRGRGEVRAARPYGRGF